MTVPCRQGLALLSVALCASCASALLEPPSVEEVAGSARHGRDALAELRRRADTLYRERTLESMRKAATTYLEGASVERSRSEFWVGACRAQVWLSGREPAPEAREAAALAAVRSAQLCGSESGAAHECDYWLAVGLGVQARERRATALDALPRMVKLLERSAAADPTIDRGGPHRVLALLFARAPGWPTGPGDAERALEQARLAVEIDAGYVPNQLSLAESLAGMGQSDESWLVLASAELQATRLMDAGTLEAREWLDEIAAARASGWAR